MSSTKLKGRAYWMVLAVAVGLVVSVLQLTGAKSSYAAPTTVRINAGGPAQTVGETAWSGCTSLSACDGYVSGGSPWVQKPAPVVSGYSSNTDASIHQTEWTGGSTSGVAYGATAFSFAIPVVADNDYNVTLHFTELNKSAAGQRVFDVAINGATALSNFDIFQQAGGEYKTITRTFTVHDTAGKINLAFIRRVENAKVDAIEVVPADSGPATTSTLPSSSPTAPITTPTTTRPTTTAPPVTGTSIAWSTIASPPFESAESSGGIINNKLYVFGGFQPASWTVPTRTATVYDIATNTWSMLPPAPFGISHAAHVVDGHNFIFAGAVAYVNGAETWGVTSVLVFNTDTHVWSTLASLPAPRGSAGAALIGRHLHVFGGVDPNRVVQTSHWVLDLDNTAAGWQTAAPTPQGRSHYAAVGVNGDSIYAMGGMTGWENTTIEQQDVYRYNVGSNTWSRMANIPIPLSHMSEDTMQIGGSIWMFGGEPKFPNYSSAIYVYNLAANSWQRAKASLPQPRFGGVADHIGNTVFYINGTIYNSSVWKGTIH